MQMHLLLPDVVLLLIFLMPLPLALPLARYMIFLHLLAV